MFQIRFIINHRHNPEQLQNLHELCSVSLVFVVDLSQLLRLVKSPRILRLPKDRNRLTPATNLTACKKCFGIKCGNLIMIFSLVTDGSLLVSRDQRWTTLNLRSGKVKVGFLTCEILRTSDKQARVFSLFLCKVGTSKNGLLAAYGPQLHIFKTTASNPSRATLTKTHQLYLTL